MLNSQVLNSVVSLAGVKGAFTLNAAVQAIYSAGYHAITDGNTRPIDETIAAIPKGKTKDGNFANNQQGLVLSALITAATQAREYFVQLHDNNGKLNKKLTDHDKGLAQNYSEAISAQFLSDYNLGASSMKAAKAEASAKTQATKAEKAAVSMEEQTVKDIKAELSRIAAEQQAADTFTLTELLKAIKNGNIDALNLAEQIADSLSAYKLSKANKAALIASKKALAQSSPLKIAA